MTFFKIKTIFMLLIVMVTSPQLQATLSTSKNNQFKNDLTLARKFHLQKQALFGQSPLEMTIKFYQISFRKQDYRRKAVSDPKITTEIKKKVEDEYLKRLTYSFSKTELDYLHLLHTNQFYKRFIEFENEFWSKTAYEIGGKIIDSSRYNTNEIKSKSQPKK